MELDQAIKNRRSIRKFKDIPIEMDKIAKIIDAARRAPSSGNLQNWRFIIIQDKEKISKIADACYHQTWINKAPVIIAVCGIQDKTKQFYGERGIMYAHQNTAAAIQNILLTAYDLELSACWVGAFSDDEINLILEIPEKAQVHAIIPMGYPDEITPEPPLNTLYTVTFLEKYGNRIKDIDKVIKNYSKVNERIIKTAVSKVDRRGHDFIDAVKKKFSK